MAGRHVGHETDRQCERLRKLPQGLDNGQDEEHRWFHQNRQTGRKEKDGVEKGRKEGGGGGGERKKK